MNIYGGAPECVFYWSDQKKKPEEMFPWGSPRLEGSLCFSDHRKKEDKMLEKQKKLLDVCFISSRLAADLDLVDGSFVELIKLCPPLASIQLILVPELLPKGLLSLMGSRPKKTVKKIFKIHTPQLPQFIPNTQSFPPSLCKTQEYSPAMKIHYSIIEVKRMGAKCR